MLATANRGLTLVAAVVCLWLAGGGKRGETLLFAQPPREETPRAWKETTRVAEQAERELLPPDLATHIPTKNLWRMLADGGPLMYPLALCSFLLVACALERLVSLRRGRVIPRAFVTRFIQQLRDGELDRAQAIEICAQNDSPTARVLEATVRKWGRPAVEIEQAIIDSGERATSSLRKYLRLINGIATAAPLLGLLGTVTGMIRAFNAIATTSALGRPERLANGIGEALLTTAFGLFVAIPALMLYLFFVSRVDKLITEIDTLSQEVVHIISAEELQQRPAVAKTRRMVRKDIAA
jgi:biopolymer transport protein ExbB